MYQDLQSFFVRAILDWHMTQDRQLPWKENRDPYSIWLSEIILQQTRVAQGLPYFNRFMDMFPDIHSLANAEESIVFKAWEGLGYYSRARNLHHTAKIISKQELGVFPDSYAELIKLKGIGPYTAAAIASFAFNLPFAVLDGNVFRVLSRVFGIAEPIDTPSGRKVFQTLAQSLLPAEKSADYNQAIMDFGALQCVPANPSCNTCPLQAICVAFAGGKVSDYPVKANRIQKTSRYFHFFEIIDSGFTWIEKRSTQDIWRDLYQFPLLESKGPLFNENESIEFINSNSNIKLIYSGKQQLTHRTVYAAFYQIPYSDIKKVPETWLRVKRKNLVNFPFPKIIHDFFHAKEGLWIDL